MKEVFVTYSWDNDLHNSKVLSFVNYLRQKGYDAEMDRMLSQQESAINFSEMMHRIVTDYKKVIIILSEGYKKKAESFKGGVGNEYSMIINDINKNPTKYILLSFTGIQEEVIPMGLSGRDIVNFSTIAGENVLFHKLDDKPLIIFSEVEKTKPSLDPVIPNNFFFPESKIISIEGIKSESSISLQSAGAYKYYINSFWVAIKNISPKLIVNLSIEVSLPGSLLPYKRINFRETGFSKEGDRIIKQFNLETKLFSNQVYRTEKFEIEINSFNIRRVQEEKIMVTVYTDSGTVTDSFQLNDYFIIIGDYDQRIKLKDAYFG